YFVQLRIAKVKRGQRFLQHLHAGFGLGFERMVMYATGIANIRDVIPYPRTVGKCQY
ncbi:MAG: amino acid--tRNA ligase-related protein, partial [Anaerostipes hadrus]